MIRFIFLVFIVSLLVLDGSNTGILNRLLNVFSSLRVLAGEVADAKKASPQEVFIGMRELALSAKATDFPNVEKAGKYGIYGVLMETGYSEHVVTLSTFVTGDASLYFSSGGGIIGGIGHETVRKAVTVFNKKADEYILCCKKAASFPMPENGQTVFYILTEKGIYMAEASENDLGNNISLFSPLFYAGQDVITKCMLVEEERNKENKLIGSN